MSAYESQNRSLHSKIKIVFCGLDQKVFKIVSEASEFNLVAVNAIMEFMNYKTKNPINYLFKWVYQYSLNNKDSFRKPIKFYLISAIFQIFKNLSFLSSKMYQQYTDYLEIILNKNIRVLDFNQPKQIEHYFSQEKIDLLVVSNWWLLPDEIIYTPTFKTVNIHPSKLPKYRGSVPTLWALKNNDEHIAVSFMVLDSGMDSGALISQYDISITPEENALSLEEKADAAIRANLVTDLLKYIKGEKKLVIQNALQASTTAKYYPYMRIDWNHESATEIVNKIKLYPHLWPNDQCFTFYAERKIRFKSASLFLLEKEHPLYDAFNKLAPEEFFIYKIILFIKAKNGLLSARLFVDISFTDSLFLLRQNHCYFISEPKGA